MGSHYTESVTEESFQKLTLAVYANSNEYSTIVYIKPGTNSEDVVNELLGQRAVKVKPWSGNKRALERYISTRFISGIVVLTNCKE